MLPIRIRILSLALATLGLLPLRAQEVGTRPEFGASLAFQRPLGDFQSQVLDATLGLGLDARVRFNLSPHQGLTARLGYEWYPAGGTMSRTTDYRMTTSIEVRETSLGVDYEWRYRGAAGGYLLVGPVYRKWEDTREYSYEPYTFNPIPPGHTDRTTPSRLGLSVGWGFRSSQQDSLEFRLSDSTYGNSAFRATALQMAFTVYW